MPEETSLRYCQHVLTVLEDGSTEVSHTWFGGDVSAPVYPTNGFVARSDLESWTPRRTPREQEVRHEEYLRERYELDVRRKQAVARAQETLFSMLTESQRQSYISRTEIEFVGSHGNRYVLGPGSQGNVTWFKKGEDEYEGRLCAHPRYCSWMPHAAIVAGQMLALTTNEPEFIRVACVDEGGKPQFPELEAARKNARETALGQQVPRPLGWFIRRPW